MARLGIAAVTCLAGAMAVGCGDAASEDVAEDSDAITLEGEYDFRYEFPASSIFAQPFARAFTTHLEKRGVELDATITPTVQLDLAAPVLEGKVTVGRKGWIIPRPKILDAEARATSRYEASLTVDIDVKFNDTSRPDVMRELVGELEAGLNDGKALEIASRLGETNIPIRDLRGKVRTDLPVKAYYDVAVTCSFDEIDGDVQAQFQAGMKGSVVARAIYNSEGVEQRRFLPDPKKKFDIDTSDVRADPPPSFRYGGPRRHVKGACAVQPSVNVAFDNGVGVSVRIDAKSTFETVVSSRDGEHEEWELRAKPELSIWGETDLIVPLIRSNLNIEKRLFLRELPELRVPVSDARPADSPTPPADGCFSQTLNRTMPEGSCVQSSTTSLWYQCNDGQWFRGGDATQGRYGPCTSSHPLTP